jgi:hypothetical protein
MSLVAVFRFRIVLRLSPFKMQFSSASLGRLQETGMTPTEPCLSDLDSVPCQGGPLAVLAGTPVSLTQLIIRSTVGQTQY